MPHTFESSLPADSVHVSRSGEITLAGLYPSIHYVNFGYFVPIEVKIKHFSSLSTTPAGPGPQQAGFN
jgi:hypothetical protein